MDTHSKIEFDLVLGRLTRDIHDLTAEQALSYVCHKLLTDAAGVYLYGLRMGLPVEYPHLLTSDTVLTVAFKRLLKWGLVNPPTPVSAGGQGRPRAMYYRVDTPEAIAALKQLALGWKNAPWKQTDV